MHSSNIPEYLSRAVTQMREDFLEILPRICSAMGLSCVKHEQDFSASESYLLPWFTVDGVSIYVEIDFVKRKSLGGTRTVPELTVETIYTKASAYRMEPDEEEAVELGHGTAVGTVIQQVLLAIYKNKIEGALTHIQEIRDSRKIEEQV